MGDEHHRDVVASLDRSDRPGAPRRQNVRHRCRSDREVVLPTGVDPNAKFNDPAKLRYNHSASIRHGIDQAYRQTAQYLDDT